MKTISGSFMSSDIKLLNFSSLLSTQYVMNRVFFFLFATVLSTMLLPVKAQKPNMPRLTSVTVMSNNQVKISWEIDSITVVDGYIIKRQIFDVPTVVDGTYHTIATIETPEATEFVDAHDNYTSDNLFYNSLNPEIRSESYSIAAFRRVEGDLIYSTLSPVMNTIYLKPVVFAECRNQLEWSAYTGWENDVKYVVYQSNNINETFVPLDTLPYDTLTYLHQVEEDMEYYYRIKALHAGSGRNSVSNRTYYYTQMPPAPEILTTDYATLNNNVIKVAFTIDPAKEVLRYDVLRSTTIDADFEKITEFAGESETIILMDSILQNINNEDSIFYYKLRAINPCGNAFGESNTVNNLHLNCTANQTNRTNTLIWNNLTGWENGVSAYRIYCSIDNAPFMIIDSILPDNQIEFSYAHQIIEYGKMSVNSKAVEGRFCYYIEAVEKNIDGKQPAYSISNQSCVAHEPSVFIPNAFNPVSEIEENRTFRPKIVFATNFKMIIFNRFGNRIFETHNYHEGWDGRTAKNQLAKAGMYVYQISFNDSKGNATRKTGYVMLYYP